MRNRHHAADSRLLEPLSRRSFLLGLGGAAGAATLLTLPGCGYYAPESCGEAFDPWSFPGDESRPEYLAVAAAILAASPHNTQPWRFDIAADRIDLYADMKQSLGPMDALHREMHIGLGCALENLIVAARHHLRGTVVTLLPTPGDETHVASVSLSESKSESSPLYAAIPRRHTNRGRYLEAAPPAGLSDALRALISEPDVQLTFLSATRDKAAFRDGTIEATQAIVDDAEMNEASEAWYRHSCNDIGAQRDGVTLDATGQGSTIRFLGKISERPDAKAAGEYWLDMTKDAQTTAAAYCVLSTPDRYSRAQQLACGRAYQRLHLWAVSQGLGMQPLNQMAELQDREYQLDRKPRFTTLLQQLTGAASSGAQMLFRIGYPWDSAFASPRRPLEWVTR